MVVTLEDFSLYGYRSCIRTSLRPHKELSVLIGKNGSGKSSLLNGLLLLRQVEAPSYSWSTQISQYTSRIKASFNINGKSIAMKARLIYSTDEKGTDSVSSGAVSWNFNELINHDEWFKIPLEMLVPSRRSRGIHYRPHAITFSFDFKEYERYLKLTVPIHSELSALSEFIGTIKYYSASQFTNPTKCPTHFEIEDTKAYRPQQGPHQKFLFDLYTAYQQRKSSEEYNQFLSIVGPSGLGLVESISFESAIIPQSKPQVGAGGKVILIDSNKTLLIPTFKLDGASLSPGQLSEGTFRTLAIIFYLLSDKSSLILIEEPEVCIHHGLLLNIINLIISCSHRKQIIISTHSDFVLDALSPEHVFLVKKNGRYGTKIAPINKSLSKTGFRALHQFLAETGNLGEFWRDGGFE
jgi:AAA15 family ATPase/GTPase